MKGSLNQTLGLLYKRRPSFPPFCEHPPPRRHRDFSLPYQFFSHFFFIDFEWISSCRWNLGQMLSDKEVRPSNLKVNLFCHLPQPLNPNFWLTINEFLLRMQFQRFLRLLASGGWLSIHSKVETKLCAFYNTHLANIGVTDAERESTAYIMSGWIPILSVVS